MTSHNAARIVSLGSLILILAMSLAQPLVAAAYAPGNSAFSNAWSRTDRPVLDGVAARTWMWGPEANTEIMNEPYAESPGATRHVQYFDKSRMEITDPAGDAGSIWYVTNGLLVVELITGKLQTGNNTFEPRNPAEVNVAGDFDDPTGPTYKTFGTLLDEAPRAMNATITERVDRPGGVTNDPALSGQGIVVTQIDNVTNHAIAGPFWAFMNSNGSVYQNGQFVNQPLFENPYFATGRPITEAYWAQVKVGGTYKDVLMQCFERRCLTYTPGNSAGFIVEAGNVGQHYYNWRYGDDPDPDAGNGGNEENPPATEYNFLTKFGLKAEGYLISQPNDVAVSLSGEYYMTETLNRRILKFDAKGIFITAWGSQGTGNGQFENPRGIAVDPDGYVYVVDKKQHRVQKFDANGAFVLAFGTPGAGNGEFNSPHGIAAGSDGMIYVADQNNNRVQRFNANGGYLGQWGTEGVANGQFKAPHGLDVSPSGLVYVADSGNDRVQIFDNAGVWQGGFGSTGTGNGQFEHPMSITVNGNGDVFVSDPSSDKIQQFSVLPVVAPAQATLQAVQYQYAGTINGAFVDPTGVDLDPTGRLVVADRGNDRIQIFASNSITVLGGPFELVDTWVNDSRGRFVAGQPRSVTVHDGYVYATDGTGGTIKKFTTSGQFVRQFGPVVSNTLQAMLLLNVADVTVDVEGNIYIADSGLDQVIKLDPAGNLLAVLGTPGTAPGQFEEPIAVAVDSTGNIYVADSSNRRIQKFAADFTFITIWYSEMHDANQVDIPIDIAVDDHQVYVTFSNLNGRVEYFDHEGEFLGYIDGFTSIGGVAVDSDGYIFIGDGQGKIQKFSPDGEPIASFGRLGTGNGEFTISTAIRVALDANGNVYATDSGAQRIQVFQPVN